MQDLASIGGRVVDRIFPGRRIARLTRARDELAAERAELIATAERVKVEIEPLRLRRRELLVQIGERLGKEIQTRDGFEKTKGLPSLLISNGSWQRIWAAAVELRGGQDEVRDMVEDSAELARFVASHGVRLAGDQASPTYLVHAFRDRVAFVDQGDAGRAWVEVDADGVQTVAGASGSSLIAQIVDESARLAGAIPRPYVQLSWSVDESGPALVTLEPDPVEIAFVDHDTDRVLGDAHELAMVKILQELVEQGSFDNAVPGGSYVPRRERELA